MMTDISDFWNFGYITDVGYTYGFYRELAPNYLNFAVVLAGFRPRRLEDGFTYCELGSGNGFSSNLLAAANPKGNFFAVDFNPTHIAESRNLAEAVGLKNITFLEKSFDHLLTEDLPDFDFITLHGVLSWINAENRAAILRFINKRLKSGGIVYVSYNCLPGRISSVPIRQLLALYAEQIPGNTINKVSGAVGSVKQAYDIGGGYFSSAPGVQKTLEQIVKYEESNPNYLAHEYFNRDWHPFFYSEVSREMSQAKLTFVTSANLFENNLNACLKNEAREIVLNAPTLELRETLKDFYINQGFRKDIYMRGTPRLTVRERFELLLNTPFVLQSAPGTFKDTIKTSFGEIKYKKEAYDQVIDALDQGKKRLKDLLTEIPEMSEKTETDNLIQILAFWVANGQVGPALHDIDNGPGTQMNQRILSYAKYGDRLLHFAFPTTGSGVLVPWLHQLFLLGCRESESEEKIPEFVWSVFQNMGRRMMWQGQPLTDEKENLEALQKEWRTFNETARQRLERMALL